jgi:hypothetical protein
MCRTCISQMCRTSISQMCRTCISQKFEKCASLRLMRSVHLSESSALLAATAAVGVSVHLAATAAVCPVWPLQTCPSADARTIGLGWPSQYHSRYACDVVAAHTFVRSLCDAYSGRVGPPTTDPDSDVGSRTRCSLAQLATWEHRLWRSSPATLEQGAAFWSGCCRARLGGTGLTPTDGGGGGMLQKLRLPPASRAGADGVTKKGGGGWSFLPVALDADVTTSFKDFLILPDGSDDIAADDHGLLLCLTAFAVLMSHAAGREDYVMGTSVSVRDQHPTATAGLIAPLSNDVPLRVITSTSNSFIDIFVMLGRTLNSIRRRVRGTNTSRRSLCRLPCLHLVLTLHSFSPVHVLVVPVYTRVGSACSHCGVCVCSRVASVRLHVAVADLHSLGVYSGFGWGRCSLLTAHLRPLPSPFALCPRLKIPCRSPTRLCVRFG